ncbi:MAG: lytic transglycosylase domain-containing protein [Deltaproteobacteria bacterium]|nr:lytic transglycosylase domain-containing protein [Deltaproteobacteria bacterium]
MVRMPIYGAGGLRGPFPARGAGGPQPGLPPAMVGGRGPTPAFAQVMSAALLARQDRSQAISSRRQEFPRYAVLGGVVDASLSRFISRTALSRAGARPKAGGNAPPKSAGRAERSDVNQYYQGGGAAARPHPSTFDPFIREAAQRHQVPEELIKAVIKVESNFNPRATSPKGAMGLMQLMPGTARDLGVSQGYDPRQNIDGGTRYLRWLLNRYRGSVPHALAAYNWGPGNLERGRSMPQETRNYLQSIRRYSSIRQVPPQPPTKAPAPPARPAAPATAIHI